MNYNYPQKKIDFEDFIKLRDALAHGRVSSDDLGNMCVIKFSKPNQNSMVTVEYKKILSQNELEEIINKISATYMEISKRMGAAIPKNYSVNKPNISIIT